MSNPLYSVGLDVGVCAYPMFNVVIPKTKVLEVYVAHKGERILDEHDRLCVTTKRICMYRVVGNSFWIDEVYLRPINPDTEYTEDTQDIHKPVEVDA